LVEALLTEQNAGRPASHGEDSFDDGFPHNEPPVDTRPLNNGTQLPAGNVFIAKLLPSQTALLRFMQSYGMSLVFHAALLVILGSIYWSTRPPRTPLSVNSYLIQKEAVFERATEPLEIVPLTENEETIETDSPIPDLTGFAPVDDTTSQPMASFTKNLSRAGSQLGIESHPGDGPLAVGSAMQGAIAVRTQAAGRYGGTYASEAAVERTLDWLARHQDADGSWSFDHASVAKCDCSRSGTNQHRTGSTGVALLTYFGAGHTFADGPRAEVVRAGLQYLLDNLNESDDGRADLMGGDTGHGGIYQHGMATAALAEALAMNRALLRLMASQDGATFVSSTDSPFGRKELLALEAELKPACQAAVNYIRYHQDPSGGGWAYKAQTSGDTSILGWQLMALTTARAEKIDVPRDVFGRASQFLNNVATGAGYAYRPERDLSDSTTAIGATSRLLIAPSYPRSRLKKHILHLSKRGPSKNNMYYNYYATQAMFAWGDDQPTGSTDDSERNLWTKWNEQTRDLLVTLQSKSDGHDAGSWNAGGKPEGGRHFDTCLAAMTLEIYYRKLPAYQRLAAEPLDLK
jgi:hypothetical protein